MHEGPIAAAANVACAKQIPCLFLGTRAQLTNSGGDQNRAYSPSNMPMHVRTILRAVTTTAAGSISLSLCACLISPAVAFAQPAGPGLTVDSVNVRQEGAVTFSTLFLAAGARSDFSGPAFLLGQTDDQAFRLYIDVDSIQQVRFNAFTFTSYLVNAREGGHGSYKYQITGNPTGSFRDTPVRVSFHVKTASNSVGTIMMPIYNATRTDLLVPEKQTEPAYVSVSGKTSVAIRLANGADTLPVSVTEISVAEGCTNCWTSISSGVSEKSPLQIEPGTTASLPLDLYPNSIPALLQGALVVKPDVPHDVVSVAVTYHTVPGGADRKQTIPATVRFGPGLFGLAAALLGGIALGLAARYLLTGKLGRDNERPLHAVLTALVFGIIAEFVGILLMAYGSSKLVLFGLDIDPRQLFPAFILAILVSGGSAVVSWTKELFGKA